MNYYSVKQISNLAGVSIKTLHHYEKIGILNPKFKTDANYRYNTETKLLRLQQILIFKELGFSLKEISKILDSKKFELIESLKKQQKELQKKSNLIRNMFHTVEKTIQYLKKGKNMKHDELYEGLGKEFGNKLRKKAIQKWGEESISNSEDYLSSLTKKDFGNLKNEFHSTWKKLFRLKKENPNLNTCSSGTSASSLNNAYATIFDIEENMYISEAGPGQNSRVMMFPKNQTTATKLFGQPNFTTTGYNATATGLRQPRGMGFDSFGNFYVADTGNNRIVVY